MGPPLSSAPCWPAGAGEPCPSLRLPTSRPAFPDTDAQSPLTLASGTAPLGLNLVFCVFYVFVPLDYCMCDHVWPSEVDE